MSHLQFSLSYFTFWKRLKIGCQFVQKIFDVGNHKKISIRAKSHFRGCLFQIQKYSNE